MIFLADDGITPDQTWFLVGTDEDWPDHFGGDIVFRMGSELMWIESAHHTVTEDYDSFKYYMTLFVVRGIGGSRRFSHEHKVPIEIIGIAQVEDPDSLRGVGPIEADWSLAVKAEEVQHEVE